MDCYAQESFSPTSNIGSSSKQGLKSLNTRLQQVESALTKNKPARSTKDKSNFIINNISNFLVDGEDNPNFTDEQDPLIHLCENFLLFATDNINDEHGIRIGKEKTLSGVENRAQTICNLIEYIAQFISNNWSQITTILSKQITGFGIIVRDHQVDYRFDKIIKIKARIGVLLLDYVLVSIVIPNTEGLETGEFQIIETLIQKELIKYSNNNEKVIKPLTPTPVEVPDAQVKSTEDLAVNTSIPPENSNFAEGMYKFCNLYQIDKAKVNFDEARLELEGINNNYLGNIISNNISTSTEVNGKDFPKIIEATILFVEISYLNAAKCLCFPLDDINIRADFNLTMALKIIKANYKGSHIDNE